MNPENEGREGRPCLNSKANEGGGANQKKTVTHRQRAEIWGGHREGLFKHRMRFGRALRGSFLEPEVASRRGGGGAEIQVRRCVRQGGLGGKARRMS